MVGSVDRVQVLGNYANFLKLVHKDYAKARQYYAKAIEINPQHPDCLGNYAVLLHGVLRDYDTAEARG